MKVNVQKNDNEAVVFVQGRVDSDTSIELETELKKVIETNTDLVIDVKELEYMSSAGIRIFLATLKKQRAEGKMLKIINANDMVVEVFKLTGLFDLFDIS